MWRRCAAFIGFLAFAGCDDPLYGIPHTEIIEEPTYACDANGVERFLRDHCISCHTRDEDGKLGAGGIALLEQLAIEAELDTPPHDALVHPGQPEASPLWQSISGIGPALLMPYGRTEPLEDHQIDHVACWILDGAPP